MIPMPVNNTCEHTLIGSWWRCFAVASLAYAPGIWAWIRLLLECMLWPKHRAAIHNTLSLSTFCAMQIDAVIVSCSCYAPNPSMAAMLVNRFGFRKDVLTFNLSGMGCSTSVVCVDMTKRLFKVSACFQNATALVH